MSEYFEKSLIPPDYSDEALSEHPEDDNPDDDVVLEDEGKTEETIDKLENSREEMVTTPFGTPPTTGSWGGGTGWTPPGSTPTGGSSGFWGSSSSSSGSGWGSSNNGWGSGNSGSSGSWGTGNGKDGKQQLDRSKRVVICDFLDCIVETYQSSGQPGLIPRDIYDLKPRFEVWMKIQAFNPEKVYAIIPKNLIPNTNGIQGWEVALSYYCCCLSSFLRVPFNACQILAQSQIGQPKEEILKSVVNNIHHPIPREEVIYIGIYSGLYGQSNRDYLAAVNTGIDYLDLGQLLNNCY